MPEIRTRELMHYEKPDGESPFREWFHDLAEKDPVTAAKIATYLERLRLGNLGRTKSLSGCEGVRELVMDFGPGWRAYFAHAGTAIILLLCGGTKRGQRNDIETAVAYWREFKQRNEGMRHERR